MDFDTAFEKLINHEGGYVDNRYDPGGETMFGISKRAYPNEDIKNLTLARAKDIYRRDYWGPAGCDVVPDRLKLQLLDFAVNSGVKKAIVTLQKVVGETPDGILGPRTLQAIQSMPIDRLVTWFNAERLIFLANSPNWPAFGRGWAIRVATNLKEL